MTAILLRVWLATWPMLSPVTSASALKARDFDRAALGSRRTGLERLDQLTVELLLGVR